VFNRGHHQYGIYRFLSAAGNDWHNDDGASGGQSHTDTIGDAA
jgi:hypothetical protein